jgi:hypothetical protein
MNISVNAKAVAKELADKDILQSQLMHKEGYVERARKNDVWGERFRYYMSVLDKHAQIK